MTRTEAARRRTCERQLDRLSETDLERHDVLNIATTLTLLMATIDADAGDEVEGHQLHDADRDRLAKVRSDLDWLQSCGAFGDIDEVRDRTRSVAAALTLQLNDATAGQTNA